MKQIEIVETFMDICCLSAVLSVTQIMMKLQEHSFTSYPVCIQDYMEYHAAVPNSEMHRNCIYMKFLCCDGAQDIDYSLLLLLCPAFEPLCSYLWRSK